MKSGHRGCSATVGKLESLFSRSRLGSPASLDYHLEIETTDFLDEDATSVHQSYVGICHWAVKISRIDLAQMLQQQSKSLWLPLRHL